MNWILVIFMLFLGSCDQKPQEVQYKEIVIQPTQEASASTMSSSEIMSTSSSILTWEAPDGWKEEAGRDMRTVSFHLISDPNIIDCYIATLAGPAGGLEANLGRWLRQLDLQATEENVNILIMLAQSLKTKDGFDVKVFDFTSLQAKSSPSEKSMIAAMILLDQTTVFVKMTGSIEAMKQNKDHYLKLVSSITRK